MKEITDKLAAEVKTLEHELRVELPLEIRTAVAMGDLSENAEYKSALERQAYVKARIAQLRERLAALSQVSLQQVPRGKVGIGSTVTLLDLDSDDELTYELVFPEVVDLERGWISIASPIGRSLVGCEEGDSVKVKIPSGTKRFEVLELATLHDKKPATE